MNSVFFPECCNWAVTSVEHTMVDFQSRYRLYGHGYTSPELKYPVPTYRELYHNTAPTIFSRRPRSKCTQSGVYIYHVILILVYIFDTTAQQIKSINDRNFKVSQIKFFLRQSKTDVSFRLFWSKKANIMKIMGIRAKYIWKKVIPCNKKIDYKNFQTRPQKFQNFKKS